MARNGYAFPIVKYQKSELRAGALVTIYGLFDEAGCFYVGAASHPAKRKCEHLREAKKTGPFRFVPLVAVHPALAARSEARAQRFFGRIAARSGSAFLNRVQNKGRHVHVAVYPAFLVFPDAVRTGFAKAESNANPGRAVLVTE